MTLVPETGVSAIGGIMIVVAALVALYTLRPGLVGNPSWRATVTPLASIIGSGFLVVGPILAHTVGHWAWLAMLGLCLTAYLFGSAIRWNIRHVEPLMDGTPPHAVALLERASQYALAFAYFISVTYYLNLFASFALRADGVIDVELTRWVASVVVVILGVLGALRGLGVLENIEAGAVGIKLGLIAGLLAALLAWNATALFDGGLQLPAVVHDTGLHEIGVLLGLVILVQGFETSRYLGAHYDPETRIRTMRRAQLLSGAIYVAFILLITPLFTNGLPAVGGETAIIDMLAPLGVVVGPIVIFAALASQLSAAVADMNGAGGLLDTATDRHVSDRIGFLATAIIAVGITWSANIYEIIVYASKAFVLYYALQCTLASVTSLRRTEDFSPAHAMLFLGGTCLCLLVLAFGIPVES